MQGKNKRPSIRWNVLAAFGLLLLGCGLIVVVPAAWKGPVVIPIDEKHAVRLMDIIGLMIATGAWIVLNAQQERRKRERKDAFQRSNPRRR